MNNTYILCSNHAGFSNKAHAWVAAYELSRINNKIIVQDWQGDQHYLKFPNTIHLNDVPNDTEWTEIDTNTISSPFLLDKDKNYKLTCGFNFNRQLCKNSNWNFLFKQVQLCHPVMDKIVVLTSNPNLIGVHIRRSDFFKPTFTDSDFNSINSQIHESWFVNVMRDLKKTNQYVKFYIASEAPKEFATVFSEFDTLDRTVFGLSKENRPQHNYVICLSDLVDLFVLSHCSTFIETPRSSYSHFASLVNKNETITSNTYKGYFYHKRKYVIQ